MEREMIEQVRRFNRTVTQRIGALDDTFLARDRPLGQARLLWEISPDGSDIRQLRARLDLDSGYLSRLLRSLESDGLVRVTPSEADGRMRTVRLTSRGQAEKAELDRLSDDAAAALVAPLSIRQRDRLMAAMAEVERLLLASAVQVDVCDPRHPDARRAVRAYAAELADRFEDGFDIALSISATEAEMSPPAGLFLLAMLHGEPVGCGALKFHPGAPAEIKRMWVDRSVRGLGLGARLLAELEARAAAHGVRTLRLETNRSLGEAIGLYRRAGYREVPAFNDEPYAHHWFEKTLGGGPALPRAGVYRGPASRAATSRRLRYVAHQARSPGARLPLSWRSPVAPSMSSRTMSACPACRSVSAIMWTRIRCRVTSRRSCGHQGTWPMASRARALIVASECAQARWYRPTISARDSSGVAHMSALGSAPSSSHGSRSPKGRPKVSPRYPNSTLARCLTRPSRLVPVGTIGRRTSYSDSPSSFQTMASRATCR
jgi:DNA-binding MarR family transcriptional regulator/GNAT superfamily N-acetyltransferase